MMHICVSLLTIIGSDNGLSPERRQAIIWTNAEILFYSYIFIQENAFETVVGEMTSILSRPQCVNIPISKGDSKLHFQNYIQLSQGPKI